MKGKYYRLLFIFSFLTVLSLMAGCKKNSNDDNNNPIGPNPNTNSLVGSWQLSKVTILGENNSQTVLTPAQMGISMAWIFRNDNTAQVTITDSTGSSVQSGTYTYANNTLTLNSTDGETTSFPLTFTSNNTITMRVTLNIDGTDVNTIMEFTKQPGIKWD